ncbi:uncharacterized protein F4812DRAFT_387824 [Daldinia caldariorum]|uniref:uncharacterized protein n=1 Tax=Daldinia caldariorum TaxID=326644 RepID=UPI0020088112|nr:uncharacterized protein F4812DRAFT_387824 [Daldinia caldariorum]KAI1468034.1 hypothetical protein F4812DRAFT_387824 [Daldinia caldariorum]
MAATALMNPAPGYHHKPPFPPAYHQQPPPQMPGMISPGESRRTPNEVEPSQRQSLPSISEVFSGAKPSHYSPTPTTLTSGHGLPPPLRNELPLESRPVPPAHDDKFYRYPPRSDIGPPPGPPGPPNSTYAFQEQRDTAKPPEAASNSHANPSPQIQYPPGQYPLPGAPISPHHIGPSLPPYDQPRPPLHSDEEYGMHRSRYDSATLNRHFESWNYQDCLNKMQQLVWTSRTVCNFAEAYSKIASEQHGGQPIPERLPSDQEVSSMLGNVDFIKRSLENLREIVQHSLATEKAREGRGKGPYEGDDDISMYGDGMKQPYGLSEVKKRRGRAAPPGRCHSCNRIDTPEWRRGPDGARTLCNACGLHYAKLERKRQMEQRSIRPKTVEERV